MGVEDNVSQQLEGMLPGVNWKPYTPDEAGYHAERRSRDWERIEEYADKHGHYPVYEEEHYPSDEEKLASANVPLEGLHTDRFKFTPEQTVQEKAGKEKLAKVTAAHPGEGATVYHYVSDTNWRTGARTHHVKMLDDVRGEVGHVHWNGDTGYVRSLEVDPEYRHLTHVLLNTAHQAADEHGDLGPLQSNELTDFSFKLMKRHASTFIPKHTYVNDVLIQQPQPGQR
jgi:hypothetical protein